MDSFYPEAIGRLRKKSKQIGEITSLAVDQSESSPGEIFVELTRLLTFFARSEGLEFLSAVVHPRHAKFYQHAMGCEVIGTEKSIAAVGGSPGIALFGNINEPDRYRSRWRDLYFIGDFATADLKSCPMSNEDCEYFFPLLNE
jgi:hypothetical protein